VRQELAQWFGADRSWRYVKTYEIADALPKFTGDTAGEEPNVDEHVFRCGDYTAYPSLNAAMKTGRLVAEMLTSRA
jgi:hypothetical protein